jgi:hypothetical protein
MSEQLLIEQALFGYREGHHLMATSVPLPPRVRQFLADVTDGSGPESSEGFEVAYTGLPVPETKYYALFCTWPAPEMPRPGCVWSHVLLLDIADLARITDLCALRELCQRPILPNLSTYERPLTLFTSDNSFIGRSPDEQRRATVLLSALYGHPENGIVVLDAEGRAWELVIFALWSQQWPRLRRHFAFSTGSLGDRRSAGVAFDLQIAPLGSQRLWRRGNLPTVVVEFPSVALSKTALSWVRTAIEDLRAGSAGALRKFFFTYGSEVEESRKAFVKLVEFFAATKLGEDDNPANRLAQVAIAFPQPAEALGLKRDLIAGLTKGTKPSDLNLTWAADYFLLEAQEAAAFSRVPLDFHLHAGLLWQSKRSDVLALLGHLPENKRVADFVDALADVLTPKEIPKIWYEQPSALSRFLVRQPELATTAAAWTMPQSGQQYLWESLRSATSDPRTWALTCGAMLSAQFSFRESETVAFAGSHLTDGLLKWLKSDNFHLPSLGWREALIAPLSKALKEGTLLPPLLALAAWTLPPEQANSLAGHRSDVQVLARQGLDEVPAILLLPSLFWLTTLGFKTSGEDGLALLGRAFFPVYKAVALGDYPGEAWERLAPVLPELRFGQGWDRCRRLRRALRQWLHDHPHLVNSMSRAAPTTEYADLIQKLS